MAVDRATLLAVGGFDEAFSRAAGEDRELMHRLRARGHRVAYEPRARVDHLHHLKLRGFLRQHHAYGRAAVLFRRRAGRVPVEPARFYRELLRSSEPRIAALLVLAQAANAAGYAVERATERRS
jgi:GT2 family glycosyltransferase